MVVASPPQPSSQPILLRPPQPQQSLSHHHKSPRLPIPGDGASDLHDGIHDTVTHTSAFDSFHKSPMSQDVTRDMVVPVLPPLPHVPHMQVYPSFIGTHIVRSGFEALLLTPIGEDVIVDER